MAQTVQFHRVELQNRAVTFEVPVRYTHLELIGLGGFGAVCKAYDRLLGCYVAIKKALRPFETPIHAKRTFREVKLLRHMRHENIIGMLDIFTPQQAEEVLQDIYIVTEFMDADLRRVINHNQLTEQHIQFIIYQIMRGLKYVHSADIVHRDLKPDNIAVNENCDLKILDFGLARIADPEMTGYVATRYYRAPEIMLSWRKYDNAVDIWSVGCIMAELLTRRVTFEGTDHVNQLEKIMQLLGTPGEETISKIESEPARQFVRNMRKYQPQDLRRLLPNISPQAMDFLKRVLVFDGRYRITAAQALEHPFLADFHDPADEPVAEEPFDSSFETQELDTPQWKRLVWLEIVAFHRHSQDTRVLCPNRPISDEQQDQIHQYQQAMFAYLEAGR
eukprot:comp15299_c0_seq1/m.12125 comp15299_c0_seq1/g.12125  ORF comp15299_c0_seq1/g.12125 comp15299_c0_seq1/m.12125 type:complete len:390 (-) comp15299_c0_seq1:175-1344(-)